MVLRFLMYKSTSNKLNIAQNNIIHFMTGLSSHIFQTTTILKIFNIYTTKETELLSECFC